jgi:hypothetical protein
MQHEGVKVKACSCPQMTQHRIHLLLEVQRSAPVVSGPVLAMLILEGALSSAAPADAQHSTAQHSTAQDSTTPSGLVRQGVITGHPLTLSLLSHHCTTAGFRVPRCHLSWTTRLADPTPQQHSRERRSYNRTVGVLPVSVTTPPHITCHGVRLLFLHLSH